MKKNKANKNQKTTMTKIEDYKKIVSNKNDLIK